MTINTAAIVFGVLPNNNQLPGQVLACLDRAAELLASNRVQGIAVIGGCGHGSQARRQKRPEAPMMKDYLIGKGVDERAILPKDKPVTTPEVLCEVRGLPVYRGNILTITEKRDRIALLADKIVGGKASLAISTVPYTLTPAEREANQYEGYLLDEAQRELAGMRPGDMNDFSRRYSFEHHLWASFVEKLKREGRFEEFLATL